MGGGGDHLVSSECVVAMVILKQLTLVSSVHGAYCWWWGMYKFISFGTVAMETITFPGSAIL